jgi:arabinan endo-1,5-alpha-L-arabinosidase
MALKQKLTLLITILAVSAVYAQPQRPRWPSDYPQAHDPVAAFCDGRWYLFATGFGVDILVSDDLKTWDYSGRVFDKAPEWAVGTVPGYRGHTWAPDILYHDGLYYLYYSCSSFGKNDSAIGVATNRTLNPDSPDYKWEDHGCLVRSVAGRDLWNAIDPNVVIDRDGNGWLSFGSFWGGIKLARLDASLTRLAEPQEWYPLCRRPEGTAEDTSQTDDAIKADPRGSDFDPGNGAVEAPFIVYRDGYYYLFVSYDLCCRGAKSTYKVVCGRAKEVTGPYLDASGIPLMQGGGTLVVGGNDRYPGAGHCAVVQKDGRDVMLFHAYDRDNGYDSRLLVRDVVWKDGWPLVKL